MQSQAATVAEYLAELPDDRRAVMKTLRALVRKSAPTATECMRYGMPSYDLGELFCAIAAQKNHYSVYVMDTKLVESYRTQLGALSVGKGCIRFKKVETAPLDLLKQIVSEAAGRRTRGVTAVPCDGADA
jgi:uncharacterized protein YdhG (YjbR/CyaY superfamily)